MMKKVFLVLLVSFCTAFAAHDGAMHQLAILFALAGQQVVDPLENVRPQQLNQPLARTPQSPRTLRYQTLKKNQPHVPFQMRRAQ